MVSPRWTYLWSRRFPSSFSVGLLILRHDRRSLTRIRQRWGEQRFREIFKPTVEACLKAKIAAGEIVHIDASLIRADVSWESLVERCVGEVIEENKFDEEMEAKKGVGKAASTRR
jgi:uncharacterized protein (DUF2062 family)